MPDSKGPEVSWNICFQLLILVNPESETLSELFGCLIFLLL